MKKQIMSIAAIAALFTTGASAFNTNILGETLATPTVKGNYAFSADNFAGDTMTDLEINATNKHGDALIYPYFTQEEGWSSEVYVRNDSANGIVAKVALYSGDTSEEVKDFNIYLSANDVFTFKIGSDSIELNEDSVVTSAPNPQDNNLAGEHSASSVLFGDANPVTVPFTEAKNGYVVIYAMAETNSSAYPASKQHHNHVQMFGEYRDLLDQKRANWRNGFGPGSLANFQNGTYKNGINAPLLKDGIDTGYYNWTDPTASLTGSIRVLHAADTSSARDMILPATPMSNFTDDNSIIAWTEGETASLADRRLDANVTDATIADYSKSANAAAKKIYTDATAFTTGGFYYTFNNAAGGSIANNLIITQPLKRVLIQLGNADRLWTGPSASSTFKTGSEYSFTLQCGFWDQKENQFIGGGSGLITSPFNGLDGTPYIHEVEVLTNSDLEKADMFGATYDSIAGYASCGLGTTAPAIVTEMVGSGIGETALTNWVYTTER